VGTGSSPLDPRLDPLGDYGGPTWTRAPQPGSPALDAVPASHSTLTTDQRGQPRPDEAADGGACDIGAVEGTEPERSISLSASRLDFGTESVDFFSVTQTVTLTNSGMVPIIISSTGITITGTNLEDFLETDTCAGTTIAPGTSCTIDITFWPGDAGTRSAVLRITDNAADSPQRVAQPPDGVPERDWSAPGHHYARAARHNGDHSAHGGANPNTHTQRGTHATDGDPGGLR
jgi:hypothetical protein